LLTVIHTFLEKFPAVLAIVPGSSSCMKLSIKFIALYYCSCILVESLLKWRTLGQKYEDTLYNLCVVNFVFRILKVIDFKFSKLLSVRK
jgi:hypothetical protein